MRIRELLRKLRLRPVDIKSEQGVDNVDATATIAPPLVAGPAEWAPTNWVPSQQDERPR